MLTTSACGTRRCMCLGYLPVQLREAATHCVCVEALYLTGDSMHRKTFHQLWTGKLYALRRAEIAFHRHPCTRNKPLSQPHAATLRVRHAPFGQCNTPTALSTFSHPSSILFMGSFCPLRRRHFLIAAGTKRTHGPHPLQGAVQCRHKSSLVPLLLSLQKCSCFLHRFPGPREGSLPTRSPPHFSTSHTRTTT